MGRILSFIGETITAITGFIPYALTGYITIVLGIGVYHAYKNKKRGLNLVLDACSITVSIFWAHLKYLGHLLVLLAAYVAQSSNKSSVARNKSPAVSGNVVDAKFREVK